MRLGSLAGSTPSTTASPVTRSLTPRPSAPAPSPSASAPPMASCAPVSHPGEPKEHPSMDLDVFTAVHGAEWQRLEVLVKRRRLSGAEADELVALYQKAATHM